MTTTGTRPDSSSERRLLMLWSSCALLLVGIWAAGPLSAQEQGEEEYVPDVEESPLTMGEDADFEVIDDMLALDEQVLSDPDTYSYDPGARPDPFRSLQTGRAKTNEKRPDGPAGLLIDEISIEGVFILDDGPVVQVQSASQQTSFLLREGDQLWDGDVLRIEMSEVVFKQSVNDPTALKPFREVVKQLRP